MDTLSEKTIFINVKRDWYYLDIGNWGSFAVSWTQTLDMSATNSIGAIFFQNEKTSLGSVLFSFKFFYVVPNIPWKDPYSQENYQINANFFHLISLAIDSILTK